MSSYLDFYCKNVETETESEDENKTEKVSGTCYTMCPQDEVQLRESEKLVHCLEVVGTERKLVKSYSRSAADTYLAQPRLLRPYSVLVHTVQYLLLEVTKRADMPRLLVYDFVNDRLRAVRQDMTIQRLPPHECVDLLEPMVRFYVYFRYLLSDVPATEYDRVLNSRQILECTKWCLGCWDKIIQNPDRDVIERLTGFLNKMDLNSNAQKQLGCDNVLMESVYILCNLNDLHPLYRYNKLSKVFQREPKLQLAYQIAIANHEGNFIKVCRLMDQLCPLTYCAMFYSLPQIQRNALLVLSHGYHNKRLSVPLEVVARWLRFSSPELAATTAQHYGLTVADGAIRFDKTEFNRGADLHQLTPQSLTERFKMKKIEYIYKYTTNDDY